MSPNFTLSVDLLDRAVRHISYVSRPIPGDCSDIHAQPIAERCAFVRRTESCREDVYYFDYTHFLYCTVGERDAVAFRAALALLVIGLLACFTVLATTADQFFCPVLAVISKTLRISESVAGVTILAFGNGSPDLFTAISNPYHDTELMFGELLGAGMFVVGVVAASVLIIRPFHIHPPGVVRDVLFFIFAVVWVSFSAYDQRFKLSDAIVLVSVYVVYLVVVLIEFFLLKQKLHEVESRVSLHGDVPSEDPYYKELRKEAEVIIRPRSAADGELDISRNRVSVFLNRQFVSRNHELFRDFLVHLNPIDLEDWANSGWFGRLTSIFMVPSRLLLKLIIPVVDYTMERHGWCKLLNMLHCLLLPLFALIVNEVLFQTLFKIPIWVLTLATSTTAMLVIFCTSRTDRPPVYHLAYAALAFAGSIQVIYVVAQEVVSLLVTIGLVLNLSKSMLGLSVLAWGNSIGDLFSNITLAKRGYGRMAFAASFGGPFFNLCLGLGITMILKALRDKQHIAFSREGAMGENCEAFLVQLLATVLLALLLTSFQGRRSVGIIMVTIYAVFLVFCLLGELQVVHPYGTDHHNEGEFVN
ncbi:sodium/potassium/calcium exchanger 6 [Culex quinquefasciatus]|uniref:Sodium/potassium/calcium exchanger 6 n=1 Tax=Culex quinquefasciatus TaxID=7176 RepID=B0W6W2_CULQU|nr:putative sodium/calcium exchanger 7 [Culex quinquefasciatus]EDS37108.1 sodium/potassium/calcium exchanger 6 [Culex quinquefasciatus]|eukprot:XP_001844446.1 sodium/potassium/calcium exchanger 6 [Culex quinquefasciatus]